MKSKLYRHLIIACALLMLSACEQKTNGNKQNGVKDAIGARPYESIRDAAENAGDAVKEAGRDIKNVANGY